jgi:hypothetical protein
MKLEWIRMKRKINSISDYHPLTLNMDTIYSISGDLKVLDDRDETSKGDDKNREPIKSIEELNYEKEHRIQEMKELFQSLY